MLPFVAAVIIDMQIYLERVVRLISSSFSTNKIDLNDGIKLHLQFTLKTKSIKKHYLDPERLTCSL